MRPQTISKCFIHFHLLPEKFFVYRCLMQNIRYRENLVSCSSFNVFLFQFIFISLFGSSVWIYRWMCARVCMRVYGKCLKSALQYVQMRSSNSRFACFKPKYQCSCAFMFFTWFIFQPSLYLSSSRFSLAHPSYVWICSTYSNGVHTWHIRVIVYATL